MIAVITGLIAGLIHVLTGPDHLTAIAPLAVRRPHRAWIPGVLTLCAAVLALLAPEPFPPVLLAGIAWLSGVFGTDILRWSLARRGFVLVHVATPLEVCEQRDRKGLYAKARAGLVREFTGISDPYEAPLKPEVVIDTTDTSPEEAAQEIILHLEQEGFIGVNGASA